MSTPEICNMMILNTAHITEEDNNLLSIGLPSGSYAVGEHGYFV